MQKEEEEWFIFPSWLFVYGSVEGVWQKQANVVLVELSWQASRIVVVATSFLHGGKGHGAWLHLFSWKSNPEQVPLGIRIYLCFVANFSHMLLSPPLVFLSMHNCSTACPEKT